GTPVHVLIVEASRDAGAGGFGFFSFALVGIPLLAGTIAIVVLLGERLLPTRTPTTLPPDLSRHARTLVEEYRLTEAVARLRLRDGSSWVGRTRAELDLATEGLALAQAPR